MSRLTSHSVATLLALTALTACGGEQKPAEAPEQPQSEAPVDTSTPQPGDAAMPQPNGQPTETPPDAPPPQGLNESSKSNSLGAPGADAPAPK